MNPGPDLGLLTLTFQPWTVGAGWQEVEGICIICLLVRDLQVAWAVWAKSWGQSGHDLGHLGEVLGAVRMPSGHLGGSTGQGKRKDDNT